MDTSKLKELQALRAKAASLEQEIVAGRAKALAALPAQFGFDSVEAFIAAVRSSAGVRRGRKPGPKALPAAKSEGRRTRATITDATRAQVKKLVGEGKTGAEIAKATGISLPSVQNIKKALGLVAARKKK